MRGPRLFFGAVIAFVLGAWMGFSVSFVYSPNRGVRPRPDLKPLPPRPVEVQDGELELGSEALEGSIPTDVSAVSISEPVGPKPSLPADQASQQEPEKSEAIVPQSGSAFVYTIHLESFRDRLRAQRRVEFLQSLSLEAFTVRVDLPGKGIFHRVFVGRFPDREQVQALRGRLRREFDLPTGIVMSASVIDR